MPKLPKMTASRAKRSLDTLLQQCRGARDAQQERAWRDEALIVAYKFIRDQGHEHVANRLEAVRMLTPSQREPQP